MTSANIIQKLDQLLASDHNFDTRAGLRFMAELVRDAFEFIEEERAKNVNDADMMRSFGFRVSNVEKGLSEFLEKWEKKQVTAEDERKFYRRAVIGGIIAIVLSEATRWLIR